MLSYVGLNYLMLFKLLWNCHTHTRKTDRLLWFTDFTIASGYFSRNGKEKLHKASVISNVVLVSAGLWHTNISRDHRRRLIAELKTAQVSVITHTHVRETEGQRICWCWRSERAGWVCFVSARDPELSVCASSWWNHTQLHTQDLQWGAQRPDHIFTGPCAHLSSLHNTYHHTSRPIWRQPLDIELSCDIIFTLWLISYTS